MMRKRISAFFMALVLCLGLTIPAAAATMTEIISPEVWDSFDWHQGSGMEAFHDGVAWRGGGDGYGAFDTDGNVIVQPYTYRAVTDFSEGVAWGRRGDLWCAIDKTGKELFTIPTVPSGYIVNDKSNFSDGLAKVYSNETKAYGFVDKSGSLVIPCEYKNVGEFHDGLAWVYDKANAYYGFIDKTGKLALPFQYSEVWGSFDNGIAVVRIGRRTAVIDKTGKEVIPQGYAYAARISSETLVVASLSEYGYANGYYFMNKAGQVVGKAVYGSYNGTPFHFVDGLAENGNGYINESGELVIPRQYKDAGDFVDGYAVVKTGDGNYSVIDKTGRVTTTLPYRVESNAGNGCFMISSHESGTQRFGFVDYTGKEIVPCKYKQVEKFSGGVAAVQDFSNKWGFVDTTGAEIVPCELAQVWYTNEPGIFVVNSSGETKSVIKSSGWTAPAVSAPAAPSTPAAPAQPSGVSAAPTASTVLVNGQSVAFDAYNIDDSNYFKLRDLAYVLNGTDKQFEVGWDAAANAISLTSGKAYTAAGGEMAAQESPAQAEAVRSSSKILLDGAEAALTAYTINGNNYFKLRDLGQAFDFGVGWDGEAQTISIDTSTGYTAE